MRPQDRTGTSMPWHSGPRQVLPSWFDVTGLAAGSVAAATLAAAEFHAARTGTSIRGVRVDSRGRAPPSPLRGCSPPSGGSSAGVGPDRRELPGRRWLDPAAHELRLPPRGRRAGPRRRRQGVRRGRRGGLEGRRPGSRRRRGRRLRGDDAFPRGVAGIAAGCCHGCRQHAVGVSRAVPAGRALRPAPVEATRPYAGIRVLDLTRVIAGPVATKFLAAYGADVLRVDPPGFEEVAAILPETTAGKRTTALDLRAGRPAASRAWPRPPTCWSRGCARTHLTGSGTATMRSPR